MGIPEKAYFILNPKSGVKSSVNVPALIEAHLDHSRWKYELLLTEHAGHATQLAQEAAAQGARLVVAVGGDGTVNEVARGLLQTSAALGILPKGSGNGLARHLGIPLVLPQALALLNKPTFGRIDSCAINGHPFFCTAGIGFDGVVSSAFANSTKRGLSSYIQLVVKEFRSYQSQMATVRVNDHELTSDFFVVAFANASQYGNNAYIAPMANIQDGLLDVCLIRHVGLAEALQLGYGLLTKQIAHSNLAEFHTCATVSVHSEQPLHFHADGEFVGLANAFEVQMFPTSLEVVAPADQLI
ncbi:diacylglycerol/lipid kinase family protein [Rufibacter quisquiliarum]|uniref:YegS/Rv2252/BmrU family lipid kinase n=1 Tax=Rufibacter quisquiliarum TaxID=1549639 RepID=A0A839GQ95_9BACT|nr:YegS/Rv2252/BmrU family lipid kinase [Rufibacter quisquiliarum]MBA9077067.1 YegS/Rv2252/BmrU family lipid kinase [Rufibacter quisquiliarum]